MAVEAARARAPFASDPSLSRGRRHAEPPSSTRSAYRRDCDRIIHAAAFRRLTYKTQVFVFHEGDHYRTRLTHTLEVAQIARSIARALGLDEDLAEALALAHDLGHPPFGHAGERALDQCLAEHGGFDHNAQTLRVVTLIERRYPQFDGLNLTWETLEGLIKHNGPLIDRARRPIGRYATRGLPAALPLDADAADLMLWSHAGAEAQAAAIADDIAYNAHDIDDGLRAELFTLDDLAGLPAVGETLADIRAQFHNLDPARPRVKAGADVVRPFRRHVGGYRREMPEQVGDDALGRLHDAHDARMPIHAREQELFDRAVDLLRVRRETDERAAGEPHVIGGARRGGGKAPLGFGDHVKAMRGPRLVFEDVSGSPEGSRSTPVTMSNRIWRLSFSRSGV